MISMLIAICRRSIEQAGQCLGSSVRPRTTATQALKNQARADETANPFALKYNEFRKKQYASQAQSYVNLNKILYDPEIDSKTENEIDRGVVSNNCWKLILESDKQFDIEIAKLKSELTPLWAKHCIAKYIGIIYDLNELEVKQNDINKQISKLMAAKKSWSGFSIWVKKLLTSADGCANPDFIKSRVFNLYQQMLNASEKDKNRLLDLVFEYSRACDDRAIVGLEKAEVIAQFINVGENLKLNVLILEFKRHLIQTELVPAASEESIETYLFYSLYLNGILKLRNQNKFMKHVLVAFNPHSFDEVISAIFKRMTVEDLVGFISNHELFQESYYQEYMAIVDRLQGEIADLDYDDPRIVELNNKY